MFFSCTAVFIKVTIAACQCAAGSSVVEEIKACVHAASVSFAGCCITVLMHTFSGDVSNSVLSSSSHPKVSSFSLPFSSV